MERKPKNNPTALSVLGQTGQAVTFEFENVPADSVERLGPLPWVQPSPAAGAGTGSGGGDGDAPKIQLLLRARLDDGPALTAALSQMKAVRSARKEREPVGVRVDPTDGLG